MNKYRIFQRVLLYLALGLVAIIARSLWVDHSDLWQTLLPACLILIVGERFIYTNLDI